MKTILAVISFLFISFSANSYERTVPRNETNGEYSPNWAGPTSATFYWWGKGSQYNPSATSTNFNAWTNWSIQTGSFLNSCNCAPSFADNVVINLVSDVIIELSSDRTIGSLGLRLVSGSASTASASLLTKAFTLTISGNAEIDIAGGQKISIGTNPATTESGKIVFKGAVTLGATPGRKTEFVGNTNSAMQFEGGLTLGNSAQIITPPGTSIFSHISTSGFVQYLNYNTQNIARFANVFIKDATDLRVGGTQPTGNITGDLTIQDQGILRLPEGTQMNRQTYGGSFLMRGNSRLYIGGLSSVSNGGLPLASLPQGSNFPGGFAVYDFAIPTAVSYYAGVSSSAPQEIYSTPEYANIWIESAGEAQTFKKNTKEITVKVETSIGKNATWELGNNVNHYNKFFIQNKGVVITGSYKLYGSGPFELRKGGALIIGSADGISSSGLTGSIQSGGTRYFDEEARYIYRSNVHQITGTGLPGKSYSLEIDNPQSVELTNDAEATEFLRLTKGSLQIKTHTLTVKEIRYNKGKLAGSDNSNLNINGINVELRLDNSDKGNYLKELQLMQNASAFISTNPGDTLNITAGYNSTGQAGRIKLGENATLTTTGGNLTLKSNEFGTASLAEIPVNASGIAQASITGDIIAERFINVGTGTEQHGKKWLFLSTPTGFNGLGQTIKESWMENGNNTSTGYGTNMTGPEGAPTWDRYSPAPSIKQFSEITGLWKGAGTPTTKLENGKGWMVFVRGDRSVDGTGTNTTPKPTTFRSKGTVYTGTKVFAIPGKEDGFYSIGNPYASAVDVRKITGLGTSGTFYIWNPNPVGQYDLGAYEAYTFNNGNYVSVIKEIGEPEKINNYILSGQAFFVQTFVDPYSLTFKESSKAETAQNKEYFRPGGQQENSNSELRSTIYTSTGKVLDGAMQIFDRQFNNRIDNNDGRKIMNGGVNLSVRVGKTLLAVERRSSLSQTDTVFFNLTGIATGKYKFSFEARNIHETGLKAWLEDRFTKDNKEINLNGITEIFFEVNNEIMSRATDRFQITFQRSRPVNPPFVFVHTNALMDRLNINLHWTVMNENNVRQYIILASANGKDFKEIGAMDANGSGEYHYLDNYPVIGENYYRIRNVNLDNTEGYSQVISVRNLSTAASLGIFPNPVQNKIINLKIENYPAGKYEVRLINMAGQALTGYTFNYPGGNFVARIPIHSAIATGNYRLELRLPDNTVRVLEVSQ